MGKPGGSHVPSSMNEFIVHEKGTRGTETSKYPEEEKEKSCQAGRMIVFFLNLYRFQGSSKIEPECTLKTAQPDGKTSCKETSCEALETEHARRNATILQLVSGENNYQRLRNQSFDSYSD